MADNYNSNAGSGGPLFRSTDMGAGLGHYAHLKIAYGGTGQATEVTPTDGLPVAIDQSQAGVTNGVQINSLAYPASTANNSSAQLVSGATFTGGIEDVQSLQAAQVMVTCDTAYTVNIDQFIDAGGTKLVATYPFVRAAGVPLNENVTLPGNFMRIRVTNNGGATTTTFQLATTFGIMDTQPNTLSDLGNLRVVARENGVVSPGNSSVANLAGGAVFTGAWEDASEFSTVMVNVWSSHASATDGLSVQFSSDGVNADITDVYTIPAATGKVFSFGVVAKFFRIVYTNGATLTTRLSLQALFSRTTKKSSSQRPQDGRPNENDFEEILSYLMGYNGGSWDRLRSISGALQVTNKSGIRTFRGRSQTFRIPGLAGTAGQKLFALHNATGSTKVITINQVTVDLMCTVAKALTVAPPIIRVHRFTAIPTGGTVLSKVAKDTALASNASVTAWGGSSADGTGTTLNVTIPAGSMLTQEFAPRQLLTGTAASAFYEGFDRETLLEEQEVVLRPLEGIVVNLDYALATQNPVTDMWIVGCDWDET